MMLKSYRQVIFYFVLLNLKKAIMDRLVTDFTQETEKILIDLINHCNGTGFTVNQLVFGPASEAPGEDPHNTMVTVTAKSGSGYVGSASLTYNRVDAQEVVGNHTTPIDIGIATKLSDLIETISAEMGLKLDNNDYIDEDLVLQPGGPTNVYVEDIAVVSDSLVYLGRFNIYLRTNEIALEDVIQDRVIEVFSYTPPQQ